MKKPISIFASLAAPVWAVIAFVLLVCIAAFVPPAGAAGQSEPIGTCAPGRDCTARTLRASPQPYARFSACTSSRTGQLAYDGDAGAYRVCSLDGGWDLLAATSTNTTGADGPEVAPAYSFAGNVWQAYTPVSGFVKPAAVCWIEGTGYTSCKGAVQRVTIAAPLAGEIMFRMPVASMNPKSAGERAFRCASWGGSVSVHITGTDFDGGTGTGYSGSGWARIYDWAGGVENAISLDCIRYKP